MAFNIKDYDDRDLTNHPNKREIETSYNRINLMCHMLAQWNYGRVYGGLRATVDHVLVRLDPANGLVPRYIDLTDDEKRDLYNGMRGVGDAVDAVNREIDDGRVPEELNGYPEAVTELTLRMLFEVHFTTTPSMRAVNQAWEAFNNVKADFLCLPWVSIQQTGSTVAHADMQEHIDNVKHDTLVDLYLTRCPKHAGEQPNTRRRAAIEFGRQHGILSRDVSTRGGGGTDPNWLQCNNGSCISVTTRHFCIVVDEGCSASSG